MSRALILMPFRGPSLLGYRWRIRLFMAGDTERGAKSAIV